MQEDNNEEQTSVKSWASLTGIDAPQLEIQKCPLLQPKKRGRPRKMTAQPEGKYIHNMDNDPEVSKKVISSVTKEAITKEFRGLSELRPLNDRVSIVATRFGITYAQAHALIQQLI